MSDDSLDKVHALLQRLYKEELTDELLSTMLEETKSELYKLIDAMKRNPSYLSRAAEFWGKIPLWQKIIGGLVLTAPTIVLGIVFHIGILIAVFCMTLFTYINGSLLLDNHSNTTNNTGKSLKEGVGGLVDLFGELVARLNGIANDLQERINQLSSEIERLGSSNQTLGEQIALFTVDNELLHDVMVKLGKDESVITEYIAGTADEHQAMKAQRQKQAQIIEGYRLMYDKLVNAQEEIDTLKRDFAATINELKEEKERLGEALTSALDFMQWKAEEREALRKHLLKGERVIKQADVLFEETRAELQEVSIVTAALMEQLGLGTASAHREGIAVLSPTSVLGKYGLFPVTAPLTAEGKKAESAGLSP